MKLAVFGCSWSYGTGQHVDIEKSPPNWVRCLAKIRPDISITNFAFGGTGVQYSAYLFDKYAKEYDYTIFQITTPYRLTSWPDYFDFKKHMIKYEDNLTQFDNNMYKCILNLSTSQIDKEPSWKMFDESRKAINFSKQYYKYTDIEYLWFEYNMFIEYIIKRANLVFFHKIDNRWPLLNTLNTKVWSIKGTLSPQQYQDYLLDDGDHFNQEGCEWQANYINDKYLK